MPKGRKVKTLGIHHLGLAVSNLDASTDFFVKCLGWSVAGGNPKYPAKFVTNGESFFTLWQANDGSKSFDRKNQVGLHHVAIRVASEADLLEVYERASKFQGVTVEFAPELLRGGPAQHCMMYDPSGIRIEFILPQ
jgi:lactoylglutathione lyase